MIELILKHEDGSVTTERAEESEALDRFNELIVELNPSILENEVIDAFDEGYYEYNGCEIEIN